MVCRFRLYTLFTALGLLTILPAITAQAADYLANTTAEPETLGHVEFDCNNYNYGLDLDSVSGRARISKAMGGSCPSAENLFYSTANLKAPSGRDYVFGIWFSRGPKQRGYSSIQYLFASKSDLPVDGVGSDLSAPCGGLLVRDNVGFSTSGFKIGNPGEVDYEGSFSCTLTIRPDGI
jgi:hypothetical protein